MFDIHAYGRSVDQPPGMAAEFREAYESISVLGVQVPWVIGETLYNDSSNGSDLETAIPQFHQRIYSLSQWWTKRAGNICPDYPDPDQYPPGAAANYTNTLGNALNVPLPSYVVGDVYPKGSDYAPYFGNGVSDVNDAIQVLYTIDHVPGYPQPGPCSDRFDAMDAYPMDTSAIRGGDGVLDVNDAIVVLYRVDDVPGYGTPPTRPAKYYCTSSGAADKTPMIATAGTVTLGSPQATTISTEQVPVYLEAQADIIRAALTFGTGDGKSPLHFVSAGLLPTFARDSDRGVVVAAWLQNGVSVGAGGRLLLGYVTGPTGFSGALRLYGASAASLDSGSPVRLVVGTASPK
jgi:hypothetical protein